MEPSTEILIKLENMLQSEGFDSIVHYEKSIPAHWLPPGGHPTNTSETLARITLLLDLLEAAIETEIDVKNDVSALLMWMKRHGLLESGKLIFSNPHEGIDKSPERPIENEAAYDADVRPASRIIGEGEPFGPTPTSGAAAEWNDDDALAYSRDKKRPQRLHSAFKAIWAIRTELGTTSRGHEIVLPVRNEEHDNSWTEEVSE